MAQCIALHCIALRCHPSQVTFVCPAPLPSYPIRRPADLVFPDVPDFPDLCCLCICIFVYLCTCIFVHLNICVIVYLCKCIFVNLYICELVYLCTFIFVHLYIFVLYICVLVYLCTCIFVCLYICCYCCKFCCCFHCCCHRLCCCRRHGHRVLNLRKESSKHTNRGFLGCLEILLDLIKRPTYVVFPDDPDLAALCPPKPQSPKVVRLCCPGRSSSSASVIVLSYG